MEEDPVPYPLLAAEFLGVTLDRDTPAIEDKFLSQGCTEDAAAKNTNLVPLNVIAGVDVLTNIKNDNDGNDIIAVTGINQGGTPQL